MAETPSINVYVVERGEARSACGTVDPRRDGLLRLLNPALLSRPESLSQSGPSSVGQVCRTWQRVL